MAYDNLRLGNIGNAANSVFVYNSDGDDIEACLADDYFNDFNSPLKTGDIIHIKSSEGGVVSVQVTNTSGAITVDTLTWSKSVQWEDRTFPATRLRQGATLKPDFDTTDLALLFPQNDPDEIAYISDQMRHSWKLGSAIRPHVHWLQESATEPTWKIDYRFANNGENFGEWVTGVETYANAYTYTSGSLVQISMFPEIDMGAYNTTSALFDFKIYRDDNDLSGDAKLKTFDFHYQINSFGSRQEYTK